MVSQALSDLLSGQCFGDSPSEVIIELGACVHNGLTQRRPCAYIQSSSSPGVHMGTDTPASSPLILGPRLIDTEDLDPEPCSKGKSHKIVDHRIDASQEETFPDENRGHRLLASFSMNFQQNLPNFDSVITTRDNSIQVPDLPGAEACADPNQQNSLSCEPDIDFRANRLSDGETEANSTPSRAENTTYMLAVEKPSSNYLKNDHLTTVSYALEQNDSQKSQTDALSTVIVNTSPFESEHPRCSSSSSSSSLYTAFDFSHRVDVESCETLTDSLVESFNSTASPSDDILPRPIISGENRNKLESDTNVSVPVSPEDPSDRATLPTGQMLTPPENVNSTASHNDFSICNHETPIIVNSLAMSGQTDPSLEETAMGYAPDHTNIPSSSSTTRTEYLQSSSYFIPAIIFRAHSPDFRTDVVGIQEVVNSSPPSSPSMTSNYIPSSSPGPPSSSPSGHAHHTPPTPPVGTFDRYNPVDIQESYYAEETFTAFPHYETVDHRQYQSIEPQVPNDYYEMPVHHQHTTSVAEPLSGPSSYPHGYYDQHVETPISNSRERYPHETITLAAPVPLQPPPRPSDLTLVQRSVELEASTSKPPPQSRKNVVPKPKRTTLAGVKLQQKKLSQPFRSPVVHPPVRLAPKPPSSSLEPIVSSANSVHLKERSMTASKATSNAAVSSSSSQTTDSKIKHRTTRAASQFKSPLSSSAAAAANSDEAALVRLTPTIQSLERKLQLLRRALKVREGGEEEVLEGLADKWTEAGREVAWEVWDAVKDNAAAESSSSSGDLKGKKRAMEDSWGWDESSDRKKTKTDEENGRNWGWDVIPVSEHGGEDAHAEPEEEVTSDGQQEEDVSEERSQPSMGAMLLQLGIAPDTLGWDEEEGTFVDKLK